MAESVLLGLNGEPNIYECAFVASEVRLHVHATLRCKCELCISTSWQRVAKEDGSEGKGGE